MSSIKAATLEVWICLYIPRTSMYLNVYRCVRVLFHFMAVLYRELEHLAGHLT